MKKGCFILLMSLFLMSLAGCSDMEPVKTVALGQETNSAQVTQQSVKETEQDGRILVSFAANNLLEVNYFCDEELTQPLAMEECYLYPKDCIYASMPIGRSDYSDKYSFAAFRIYEYNAEGRSVGVETIIPEQGKLAYEIPLLEKGHSISVVPVGTYLERTIVLKDYVRTEENAAMELNGAWTINNKEYYREEVAISPLTSYVVSYKYNSELYYFVAATPADACHYPRETGNEDGEVIFKNQEPENALESFSVELHKYLSASIDNSENGVVSVVRRDTGEQVQITKKIELNRLKCGTVIEIETDKEHKLEAVLFELDEPTETAEGYLYTVTVPEVAEAKMKFEVLEWEKKTIDVTVDKETAVNWWNAIFEKEKENAYVTLRCGETVYTYQELQKGNEVILNEYDTLEISVSRNLPENYRVHVVIDNQDIFAVEKNSSEYTKVLEYDEVSAVRITLQNIENEAVEQKTRLQVILDKSLDSNVLFSVSASGKNIVKETGYIKGKEIIFYGDIDAKQEVVIEAKNIQLYPNTAIKLEISRDDGSREIRYCQSGVLKETVFAECQNECSKELSVTVSTVDVMKHEAYQGKNCHIQVELADERGHVLKNGEVLENSREVVMSIIPFAGYYIDTAFGHGRYMQDRVYERTMEYGKYVEKLNEIIEKNPVKKEEK